MLALIGIVAYEAAGLWIARRRGRAASRLHVRIVLLFSFIAALPAILMAVIASITLNQGLDRWFAERTEAIIDTSRSVAQAYVQEHSRVLGIDLLAIAGEFNRVTPNLEQNAAAISAYLSNQAKLRGLSTIQLIHRDSSKIVEGKTDTNLAVPPPPQDIFAEAESGRPALIAPGTTNLVGGVIKLTGFDDVYLYLARPIDPKVTRYLRLTEENAAEYEQLQANRFGVQVAFAILFVGVALGRASLGHLDRARFCPQPGIADPQADRRSRAGLGRQSRRPRPGPRLGRRYRLARGDLQHHDRPAEVAARRAARRQRQDRRAPPLHRGRAVGSLRRRNRPRREPAG